MKITHLDKDFFQSIRNRNVTGIRAKCSSQGTVVTIGNFDGLHLGHQMMINQTIALANEEHLKSAVMVFEPMPKEFFTPTKAPPRLMNRIETEYVFDNYIHLEKKIDELIIVDFNDDFRSLSAEQFANLLINELNVKVVVLGDDFRFGHDRMGDSDFLRLCGLKVLALNTVTDSIDENVRISSTRIRELLHNGQLNQSKKLLGRDYCMIGKVMHGDKIGRTLNFPTANVELNRIKPALHGVFAVDVQVLNEEGKVVKNVWKSLSEEEQGIKGLIEHSLFGTANIGTRPAVNGKEWRLEVHFPEFKGDLYGKLLKVRFLHFLHGERNYDGLESLKLGIQDDVKQLIQWRKQQGS